MAGVVVRTVATMVRARRVAWTFAIGFVVVMGGHLLRAARAAGVELAVGAGAVRRVIPGARRGTDARLRDGRGRRSVDGVGR
ncbi:MAG TPA: hypothetical protein VN923_11910 [Thermoanaerobaculia bacterium]|nr:hypothetical protein [Thermoanaerobaculia bacterium]